MGMFVKAAGTYKFGRKMYVKVAGVWRRVINTYRRDATSMKINSNFNQGLDVSAFTQSNDIGSENGAVTYYLAAVNTTEFLSSKGLSSLVQLGEFFNTLTVTVSGSSTRIISLTVKVAGADLFSLPSSVTVSLYNAAGAVLGTVVLPQVSVVGLNAKYELSGSAVSALAVAVRADFTASPAQRRVALSF